MPSRGVQVVHEREVAPQVIEGKPITQSEHSADNDFALLQAQLRLAKAAQVLNGYGVGHGLGDQRAASLASTSNSSTPSLVYDAPTPYEHGTVSCSNTLSSARSNMAPLGRTNT